MQFYKHDFKKIEDYLHHRQPYLQIEQIDSLDEQRIVTSCRVDEESFFITGHFPGAPILPGAMMQEMSTQTAGILIAARYNPMEEYNTHDPFFNKYALGVLVKVKFARFRGFARPGDHLKIQVDLEERVDQVFDFSAKIFTNGNTIMQNRFQLTNMLSSVLQGKTEASEV